VDPKKVADILN
jgi:hypothetical protein